MNAGQLTVAVDAMSGDHGADVAVPAALDVLAATPDLRLIIVGRGEVVRPLLGRRGESERCRFVEATEVVGNSPQEFAGYLKGEIARWGKVVKASGATAE